MKPGFDKPIYHQVVCRPGLPLDTPGMLKLTSQIWEGEDYVPKVWHEWLFDPDGLLCVAELQGKVVGIGKLTRLSERDWWLEGLRVHPQYEGQRIASRIHSYLLEIWQKIGSGAIRFATSSKKEPVIHLAQVNGFYKVGEYSTFKSPVQRTNLEQTDPFSHIKPGAEEQLAGWLTAGGGNQLPFGLMNLGWQFAPPVEAYLTAYLEGGQAWWWHRDRGVVILVEKRIDSQIWGRVQLLAYQPDDLVELLIDLHNLAAQLNFAGITWVAPLLPGLEKSIAEAGFKLDWESSLLVFEKTA